MQAVVVRAAGGPVVVEDVDRPSPGPGQVLIRVHACGICRSDLDLAAGHYAFARMPVIPGHEVAGVVVEAGDGVRWPTVGTRVGMPWLYSSCGRCDLCVRGDEILCVRSIRSPESPPMAGTPSTRGLRRSAARRTAIRVRRVPAVRRARGVQRSTDRRVHVGRQGRDHRTWGTGPPRCAVRQGDGRKGRGHHPRHRQTADRQGTWADHVIDTDETGDTPGDALARWGGGADIILATAPSAALATSTVAGLAPDGTLVVLGVDAEPLAVRPLDLILGRRRVMGSPTGSRHDVRDVLAFAATHDIRPHVTTFPLRDVDGAFAHLRDGRLAGRAVLSTS